MIQEHRLVQAEGKSKLIKSFSSIGGTFNVRSKNLHENKFKKKEKKMSKKEKMIIKEEDGARLVEIIEEDVEKEFLPVRDGERQSVTGYWRSDGNGHHEKFVPYFNVTSPQQVEVRTKCWGKISISINFYNVTTGHGGPTLPQSGGKASLDPGYWKMYLTGWITSYPTKSGIEYTVIYK